VVPVQVDFCSPDYIGTEKLARLWLDISFINAAGELSLSHLARNTSVPQFLIFHSFSGTGVALRDVVVVTVMVGLDDFRCLF